MTPGNFFERCRACRACCRTSDRFVHIHVCGHERRLAGILAFRGMDPGEILVTPGTACPFLGVSGCVLGDAKPLQCRMFPLLILHGGLVGVDPACTYSGEYLAQLRDPSSDGRRHYDAIAEEASRLSDVEKALLAEWSRYVCDVIVIARAGEGLNYPGEEYRA